MTQKTGALIFDETADRYDIRFDLNADDVGILLALFRITQVEHVAARILCNDG